MDLYGREITDIVDRYHQNGSCDVSGNGELSNGTKVPSGAYLYKLGFDDQTITRRMILLRRRDKRRRILIFREIALSRRDTSFSPLSGVFSFWQYFNQGYTYSYSPIISHHSQI